MKLVTAELDGESLLIVRALLGTRELPDVIDSDDLIGRQISAQIAAGPDGEPRMVEVSSLDGTISGRMSDGDMQ